jgi:hypothetical protein
MAVSPALVGYAAASGVVPAAAACMLGGASLNPPAPSRRREDGPLLRGDLDRDLDLDLDRRRSLRSFLLPLPRSLSLERSLRPLRSPLGDELRLWEGRRRSLSLSLRERSRLRERSLERRFLSPSCAFA